MLGIVSEFARNGYGLRHLRVNIIAVTSLAASILKASTLQHGNKFSYLRRHDFLYQLDNRRSTAESQNSIEFPAPSDIEHELQAKVAQPLRMQRV
jgi:hypothetical protein